MLQVPSTTQSPEQALFSSVKRAVMITNPYQPVIDWLHTPDGEHWSEIRVCASEGCSTAVDHFAAGTCEMYLTGVFSVKGDLVWPGDSHITPDVAGERSTHVRHA